jgi:hypothetical protein
MSEIKNVVALGNYTEVVLMDEDSSYDINDKVFYRLINNVRSKGYNCFQKHFKEYVFRNMFFENSDKKQVKIYKKTLLNTVDMSNGVIKMLTFNKEKQPYHLFPASTMLHSISYVSRLIFKENNRVYINFEKRKFEGLPDMSFNKVYINYNHDDNVDLGSIQTAIEKCIMLIA